VSWSVNLQKPRSLADGQKNDPSWATEGRGHEAHSPLLNCATYVLTLMACVCVVCVCMCVEVIKIIVKGCEGWDNGGVDGWAPKVS
jgi:hypothetical protein